MDSNNDLIDDMRSTRLEELKEKILGLLEIGENHNLISLLGPFAKKTFICFLNQNPPSQRNREIVSSSHPDFYYISELKDNFASFLETISREVLLKELLKIKDDEIKAIREDFLLFLSSYFLSCLSSETTEFIHEDCVNQSQRFFSNLREDHKDLFGKVIEASTTSSEKTHKKQWVECRDVWGKISIKHDNNKNILIDLLNKAEQYGFYLYHELKNTDIQDEEFSERCGYLYSNRIQLHKKEKELNYINSRLESIGRETNEARSFILRKKTLEKEIRSSKREILYPYINKNNPEISFLDECQDPCEDFDYFTEQECLDKGIEMIKDSLFSLCICEEAEEKELDQILTQGRKFWNGLKNREIDPEKQRQKMVKSLYSLYELSKKGNKYG